MRLVASGVMSLGPKPVGHVGQRVGDVVDDVRHHPALDHGEPGLGETLHDRRPAQVLEGAALDGHRHRQHLRLSYPVLDHVDLPAP
jgi:hypothetical protein